MPWGTDVAFFAQQNLANANERLAVAQYDWLANGVRDAEPYAAHHSIRGLRFNIDVSVPFPSGPLNVIGCSCLPRYVSAGAWVWIV
jgi:hypothetical protein